MPTVSKNWTDNRLDDLSATVDRDVVRVDTEIRQLRVETRGGDSSVRSKNSAICSAGFCVTMIAALIGSNAF